VLIMNVYMMYGANQNSGLTTYTNFLKSHLDFNVFDWKYKNRKERWFAPFKEIFKIRKLLKEGNIIHVQYHIGEYMPFFLPLLLLFKSRKGKIVLTLHEDYKNVSSMVRRFHNIFYLAADVLITNEHKRFLPFYLQERTVVIPHGVNNYDKKAVVKKGTILLPGFIQKWKGHHLAIKAMAHGFHPEYKLIIVGKVMDQAYFEDLKHLALKIGVAKQIEWHNEFVPQEEFERLFLESEVVVLPHLRSTMSGVLALSLGYSKPCIISDLKEFVEVTKLPGCYYFKAGHFDDLAVKLYNLLESDSLRENEVKLFDKLKLLYDWKNIAEQHNNLYSEIATKVLYN